MRVYVSIAFVLAVLSLRSQDFKKDIVDVFNQQNKLPNLCYSLVYTLRESHNVNSKVLHKSNGKYIKIKDSYLSSIDHITSITMPDVIIMVNKADKTMILKKNMMKTPVQPDIMKQLEEYNKFTQKIVTTDLGKGKYSYTVELKKTLYQISKYEIVIDTKAKSIVRLSLFYKNALAKDDAYHITGKEVPRLDIEFNDYNNFNLLKEAECKKNYYVTQNHNKLTPTSNFLGYAIKQL